MDSSQQLNNATRYMEYGIFTEPEYIVEILNPEFSEALVPLSVFFGLLSAVGVLGNSLVLVVFNVSKEYRASNFRVFVVSFGLVDLLTCLLVLPMEFAKNHVAAFYNSKATCKAKCFLNMMGMVYAALLLLLISVERYRKVCHPLRSQLWPSMALKLVGLVALTTFILSLPAPIMCGITHVARESPVNATHVLRKELLICKTDETYVKSKWRMAYKFFLTLCLLVISVSVVTMYALIGRVIRKQTGIRRTNSSIRRESFSERNALKPIQENMANNGTVSPTRECLQNGTQGEKVQTGPESPVVEQGRKKASKQNPPGIAKTLTNGSFRKQGSLKSACHKGDHLNTSESIKRNRRRLSSYSGPGGFPYKTIIWLVLTIIFLVTYAINAAISFVKPTSFPNKYALYSFMMRLYFINSVANPIVYAVLDQRFRRSCRRLFSTVKEKVGLCFLLDEEN